MTFSDKLNPNEEREDRIQAGFICDLVGLQKLGCSLDCGSASTSASLRLLFARQPECRASVQPLQKLLAYCAWQRMKAVNSFSLDLIHAACSEKWWLWGGWHTWFGGIYCSSPCPVRLGLGYGRPSTAESLFASAAAQGFEANVYQMLGEQVTVKIQFYSVGGIILWGWRNTMATSADR